MITTRSHRGAALLTMAALVAGSFVAAATPAGAAPYDGRIVISQGHTDLLYVSQVDGAAVLQVHDDTSTPSATREAADVVVHVKPSVAQRTANDYVANGIPGFTTAGSPIYVLPQTFASGQVFAGFGHTLPTGSSVTYELSKLDGPGKFATWQAGEEGPVAFWNSAAGLPQSFTSTAGHEHLSWGFSAEGAYTATVGVSAVLPDGSTITSAPVDYSFFVGNTLPADPQAPPAPTTALSIRGLSSHYHSGNIANLRAVQTPATTEDHYHWFTRAPGATEWTVVPGALGPKYSFIAREADDDLQIMVRLYDHDHKVIAESTPVTFEVDNHGSPPNEGPEISATLPENAGSLVISVDAEDRKVALSDLELNAAADRYVASGDAGGIRVTDTRSSNAGWSASGRVRQFTTVDGHTLEGEHLAWTPAVLTSSSGQTVTAGPAVLSKLNGGPGVRFSTTLGSAAAGQGRGTAELGAKLALEAPPTLKAGTYRGLLTLTVI